jgi:hypothetical protein
MPLKYATSPKSDIFGLFFRAGARHWFWGWKAQTATSRPVQDSSAPTGMLNQASDGRWSNVAEWLRRMHAEADRPATAEEQKQSDRRQTQEPKIRFAGLICFWRMPRKKEETRRERFFTIYEDLREAVKQNLPSPVTDAGERRWNLVRISEPGRWFLGFGRR